MFSNAIVMLIIFVLLIVGLCSKRFGAAKVFVAGALVVYLAGFVSTDQLLAKSSSNVLVTLVLIMLISIGLERFSWIKSLSSMLLGPSYTLSVLRLGLATSLTSALLNNTAVVAALMHSVSSNPHHAASKLLLPMSYAAILGGTMTLVGTSTNLIVAALHADATGDALAFFDFFLIGFSLTLAGVLTLVFSARLLPDKEQRSVEIKEYLVEADVGPSSPLIGRSVLVNGLRDLEGLFLVEIVRGDYLVSPVSPNEFIEKGDKLIFSGDVSHLDTIGELPGVTLFAAQEGLLKENMVEAIVLPGAVLEGQTIKAIGFRALFDAAVVGIRRGGRKLSGQLGRISLKAGDSLILAVGPDFFARQNLSRNFALLNEKQRTRVLSFWQQGLCGGTFFMAILAASLNLFPLIKGLVVTLALMLLTGVVQAAEIRRRFPFDLWLIIASALIISQAMVNTGLTADIGGLLSGALQGVSPMLALIGVYLTTVLLTELMTNNAAAAVVFPLAWATSVSLEVSVMPFSMAVAYGASASFLTPYGYTTNLMVQNVGEYSFNDYLCAGAPITVIYAIVVLSLLPIVFPF